MLIREYGRIVSAGGACWVLHRREGENKPSTSLGGDLFVRSIVEHGSAIRRAPLQHIGSFLKYIFFFLSVYNRGGTADGRGKDLNNITMDGIESE